ncbi:WYL domain-containing protein [Bacteroides sp. OttesenSCG-928-D19]|nr:WYL domain-containing protein [Bacteroides sp. OttesenSCG-928-D19]
MFDIKQSNQAIYCIYKKSSLQHILSQGGEVEVLSPQSLRDEVVDELKRLNDIYR